MSRKAKVLDMPHLFQEDTASTATSDARVESASKKKDDPSFFRPYRVAFAVLGDHPERGPASFGAVITQGQFQTEWSVGTLTLGRDAMSEWGRDFVRRICWRVNAMVASERVSFLEDDSRERQDRARQLAASKLSSCEEASGGTSKMLRDALKRARETMARYESDARTTFKYE